MADEDPENDDNNDDALEPKEVEGDDTEKEKSTEKNKKNEKRRNIIIAMSLLFVVAGGLYFFFFVINAPQKTIPTQDKKSIETKLQKPVEQNVYLDVDPITVGLMHTSNKRQQLRIQFTLRLSSKEESATIANKLPIIRDTLITFLSSMRATDFNSSNSILYLKEEMAKRVNKIISPIVAQEILFQEITLN
ncbi:flagellar basal body-associated FliL family protein [Rickettsiaceae bacterium]|nr:flagellar basal body-associated FliL family protein [Rickettsiaceae bacterium]